MPESAGHRYSRKIPFSLPNRVYNENRPNCVYICDMTRSMKSALQKAGGESGGAKRDWHLPGFSFLLFFMLLITVHPAAASSLFDDDSILDIELKGPLTSLYKNKNDEVREQRPFTLVAEGIEHNIKVRVRGKSRIEACFFPPIRLNFKKGSVADTVFADQDKLKLVTHCSLSRYAEPDILEEYAAYKIFNELTEISYRVRLLRIRYTDTEGQVKGLENTHYGFIIEPTEHMAERNGGMAVEKPGVALKWLDPEYSALVYLYQYLIGNTDWSLAPARGEELCCHNVSLIEIESRLNPVPYDFDMSGLVNAHYANPHPNLSRIDRVTQRLYRGYCTDPAILRETIHLIQENRGNIVNIINDLPLLKSSKKEQKIDFLEKVLEAAENEDKLIRMLENDCIG